MYEYDSRVALGLSTRNLLGALRSVAKAVEAESLECWPAVAAFVGEGGEHAGGGAGGLAPELTTLEQSDRGAGPGAEIGNGATDGAAADHGNVGQG